MITVQEAISRFRRDATMSAVLKIALAGAAAVVLSLHFFPAGRVLNPTLLLMALGIVWMALWVRTVRGSRLAAESSTLIQSGQLDQAEEQIGQSLRAFSMSKAIKGMSLMNLALVRVAQKRWPEAAALCREVLSPGGGATDGLTKTARLLLADAHLEMGDLRGAHEALAGLYSHRLVLGEALNLLRVQTDYLARIGAWGELMRGIESKVQLADLMPASSAARTQAQLAVGARRMGRTDWATWLTRRVELLADVESLRSEIPLVAELWQAEEKLPEGAF